MCNSEKIMFSERKRKKKKNLIIIIKYLIIHKRYLNFGEI